MVTGLPMDGYRHMDLLDEVWPYFVEKDISHVFYHVVILPLQRRVGTRAHKLKFLLAEDVLSSSFPLHSFSFSPALLSFWHPPFSCLSFSSITSTPLPSHLSSISFSLLLPCLQAFIYFDDVLTSKEFVSAHLAKPFTLGGCDLTLHFLLQGVKPCTTEVWTHTHMYDVMTDHACDVITAHVCNVMTDHDCVLSLQVTLYKQLLKWSTVVSML